MTFLAASTLHWHRCHQHLLRSTDHPTSCWTNAQASNELVRPPSGDRLLRDARGRYCNVGRTYHNISKVDRLLRAVLGIHNPDHLDAMRYEHVLANRKHTRNAENPRPYATGDDGADHLRIAVAPTL